MRELLYFFVQIIAKIHNEIMQLNNSYEIFLTDKELHFLVIGLLGMGMIFVIHPLFKYLASRGKVMSITFIYVFTVIMVITFAIEIGQKISNTGHMDFVDIMYGLVGFLAMFVFFCLLRWLWRLLLRFIGWLKSKRSK